MLTEINNHTLQHFSSTPTAKEALPLMTAITVRTKVAGANVSYPPASKSLTLSCNWQQSGTAQLCKKAGPFLAARDARDFYEEEEYSLLIPLH